MKIVLYLVAGFLCLIFFPIAFPVFLIVAVLHTLENGRKNRQKRIVVEALREAGVTSAANKAKENSGGKLSFGAYLVIVIVVLMIVKSIFPE